MGNPAWEVKSDPSAPGKQQRIMTDSVLLNHRLGSTGSHLMDMLAVMSRLYGTLGKDFLQGPYVNNGTQQSLGFLNLLHISFSENITLESTENLTVTAAGLWTRISRGSYGVHNSVCNLYELRYAQGTCTATSSSTDPNKEQHGDLNQIDKWIIIIWMKTISKLNLINRVSTRAIYIYVQN